jgi:hypothetical protein
MYLVTGNFPITTSATSLAILPVTRTIPSVITAKSPFLNTLPPANPNTALTTSGLSGSRQSQTKLSLALSSVMEETKARVRLSPQLHA